MQPIFDQVQIERYLKGQMVPVEVDLFENRMRTENVLMAEVKAFARINELVLPDREIFKTQAPAVQPVDVEEKESGKYWIWIVGLILLAALIYYLVAT